MKMNIINLIEKWFINSSSISEGHHGRVQPTYPVTKLMKLYNFFSLLMFSSYDHKITTPHMKIYTIYMLQDTLNIYEFEAKKYDIFKEPVTICLC